MMNKKVSIVVPIYNGESYIDNCIKNIKAQTYSNLEIILVDDGSTDSSGKKCDEYASQDDRIIVIHQPNGGLSAARNAGMKKATGDYVYFYDVDDDIIPTLVEDNVKLAVLNDADVVMFGFWYHDVDTGARIDNVLGRGFVGNADQFFDDYLLLAIEHEVFNAPWNKLYKRSFLVDKALHFWPKYPIYEDIVFASIMLQHADKIVVNDNLYYVYYVRSSGSLITKYVDGYFDSVTFFYDNAMDYCRMHENNKKQIAGFSKLYVKLVTTNLKQISCNNELEYKEKIKRIRNICKNDRFRKALRIAKLEPRRQFVRFFALTNNAWAVYRMYRFLGRVK